MNYSSLSFKYMIKIGKYFSVTVFLKAVDLCKSLEVQVIEIRVTFCEINSLYSQSQYSIHKGVHYTSIPCDEQSESVIFRVLFAFHTFACLSV